MKKRLIGLFLVLGCLSVSAVCASRVYANENRGVDSKIVTATYEYHVSCRVRLSNGDILPKEMSVFAKSYSDAEDKVRQQMASLYSVPTENVMVISCRVKSGSNSCFYD